MFEYEKNKLKKYIGDDLYSKMKNHHCMIAGGSILSIFSNTEINDIDLYFRCKEDLRDFLLDERDKYVISKTNKAIMYSERVHNIDILVQCIYFKYFENPEKIFETFDFTICMAAFDFDTEEFVFHDDFFRNNMSKTLRFNQNTAYPIVSALRIEKYKNKGFKISKSEFCRVILTCMQLEIDSWEDLKDSLGGMYGESYDKMFEDVKDEKFDMYKAIEMLGKLGENASYKSVNDVEDINDWTEFVYRITGCKIKVFKKNDKYYLITGEEIEEIEEYLITCKDSIYEVSGTEEDYFPIKKYKWVKKVDDKYFSFYDNSFEWVIGENTSKGSEGLFGVSTIKGLEKASYNSHTDRVALEFEVRSIDDYKNTLFNGLMPMKAYVIREVPKQEIDEALK